MNHTTAVATQSLSKHFGDVKAVEQLSLEIPTGIIFGFLGPNGSGKTTTIRLLLGLLEPTAGGAAVLGNDILHQAEAIRENCGALMEHTGLYERLSGEENLDFYGRIWHLPTQERQQRIQELLEHIGLWERRKEKVSTWSRGMRQKLAVVRTLMHRPRLIFLDEPTSGLDPIAAASLRDDLARLARNEGVTIFLNTHNLTEAEKLCSLVGVIHKGKLLALDSPASLRARASRPTLEIIGAGFNEQVRAALQQQPEVVAVNPIEGGARLDLKEAINTAPLVNYAISQGVEIEEVRKGTANLEDVFLQLVENDNEVLS